ncbi:MOSC domain-containing protein [Nostoc sp. XA010]|uniref:MOSC domain-containing protein n=1 Tax=Nostoc sp. XA010 TaxID=2780407 RepID=UPI001E3BF41E|nr:MOSC domain-containing protein [Nostoc sp. XA010]MCC5662047.1 MOSC domain-containing protein [Nostoc sp. XA010]
MRELNLDGDRQADLTVHGGVDKAVYVYPFEHYDYWRSELPNTELKFGIFVRMRDRSTCRKTPSCHFYHLQGLIP